MARRAFNSSFSLLSLSLSPLPWVGFFERMDLVKHAGHSNKYSGCENEGENDNVVFSLQ